MTPINLKIIVGSTRPGRFSEHSGRWILAKAQALAGVEAELIDLRDWPLPWYNEAGTPSTLKGKYHDEVARRWLAKVAEGDAYIVVAPEYNHGYPAVLKNALDWPYDEWNNKPIGFVAHGSVGGARSVEQLRLVAVELQMAPIRQAVHIPAPWTLTEGETLKPGALEQYNAPADTMLTQLLWWARALKAARQQV